MKSSPRWFVLPVAISVLLLGTQVAHGDVISTPLTNVISMSGQSGGSQSSSCGNIPASPHQQVQVNADLTSLRFRVESPALATLTLLVRGPNGQVHCVMADEYADGKIEIPGLWDQGQYSVYVGEQGTGQHSFTLSIVP
ncbi:MAG: hypothetical protein ACTS2F_10655 [Thainema sp.]